MVLSNVGMFRMHTLGSARLRLLDLVALSAAQRARAGAFRVQLSTSPRFMGAIFTTTTFAALAQGKHLAKGHAKH
jgi:hypothetical protein